MAPQSSDVALDLKIHLSLTKKDPIGLAMNELAKALQYLPHVHHIDFLRLHAGDEEVEMFMQALGRASNVKKVIRILKERVKKRKRGELAAAEPMRRIHRPPSFHQYLTKIPSSSTQDWTAGVAQFSNGTVVPMKPTLSDQKQAQAPHQNLLQSHQRRRAFRIPGVFYVRYILDFSGIWFTMARFFDKILGRMPEPELTSSPTQNDDLTLGKKTTETANPPGRGWNHRRRRHLKLVAERVFWLLCIYAAYIWKPGKT
jgi:hypothetical protein